MAGSPAIRSGADPPFEKSSSGSSTSTPLSGNSVSQKYHRRRSHRRYPHKASTAMGNAHKDKIALPVLCIELCIICVSLLTEVMATQRAALVDLQGIFAAFKRGW